MAKGISFKQHPHIIRKVYKSIVNVKNTPIVEIKKDKEIKTTLDPKVVEETKPTPKAKTITNAKVVENKENKTESNE